MLCPFWKGVTLCRSAASKGEGKGVSGMTYACCAGSCGCAGSAALEAPFACVCGCVAVLAPFACPGGCSWVGCAASGLPEIEGEDQPPVVGGLGTSEGLRGMGTGCDGPGKDSQAASWKGDLSAMADALSLQVAMHFSHKHQGAIPAHQGRSRQEGAPAARFSDADQ